MVQKSFSDCGSRRFEPISEAQLTAMHLTQLLVLHKRAKVLDHFPFFFLDGLYVLWPFTAVGHWNGSFRHDLMPSYPSNFFPWHCVRLAFLSQPPSFILPPWDIESCAQLCHEVVVFAFRMADSQPWLWAGVQVHLCYGQTSDQRCCLEVDRCSWCIQKLATVKVHKEEGEEKEGLACVRRSWPPGMPPFLLLSHKN